MLKSSLNFKSLAGVFFALFVLSACGGGGGAAAAAAPAEPVVQTCAEQGLYDDNGTCVAYTETTCLADSKYWDSSNCVAKLSVSDCVGYNGVNAATNTCLAYTAETCGTDGKYWDNSSCVAAVDSSSCGGNELVVNNQCVAAIDPSTCTSNQLVVNNECTAYTAETCDTAGKYWDTSSNCVAKLTVSDCDGYNGLNESTNTCIAYTQETCEADNKYWGGSCVAAVDPSTCDTNQSVVANACSLNDELLGNLIKVDFVAGNDEYMANPVLAKINANTAYLAGHTGKGQIIAVVKSAGSYGEYSPTYVGLIDTPATNKYRISDNRTPDDTSDDFNVPGTNHIFVEAIADIAADGTINSLATDAGACDTDACTGDANQNHRFNHMVGRRDNTGIHGVAYDAQIKYNDAGGNNLNNGSHNDAITAAIRAGGGAGIAAQITDVEDATGLAQVPGDNQNSAISESPTATIETAHKDAFQDVVAAGTVMVSSTGFGGFNTVNGWVSPDCANPKTAIEIFDNNATEKGNRSTFQDDISGDLAGKWLVATTVDANNKIIGGSNPTPSNKSTFGANGCGEAKQYCLSVPRIETADNDGTMRTVGVEYTLAGALAVIKEAFPDLTVEQTVALTLGTADYIAIGDVHKADGSYGTDGTVEDDVDFGLVDDTTGKYNAVYGHGLLNLGAAVTLSADAAKDANVISSSASPIGAIWGDTKLTLSHLFGTELSSVNLGVQDGYGRHFVLDAQNTSREAVNSSFDDYMANMLGDASQSQTLGTELRLNYSNANQTWMDLQYKAGKATTSIAFQDSYKIKPLHDNSASTILRANNIRPASNNIGMMDIDYALNSNLTLSSYAARGEYDTGYKFDELGTDFDVNYKKSHLNIAIGNIREHDQFLGTNTTGAYALNAPTVSRFTDVTYGHDLGGKFNIYANYINYETDVDMLHDQFASIDGLQADQYQIGFTGKDLISKDDSLNVALITKLGVTDGALNQNTVIGYTADGGYNNVNQSYDLTVDERHQQFEITYQGKLYQNADKVSAFRDNRFFTSIKVDSNLNHVQGASQVEVISGINIRY